MTQPTVYLKPAPVKLEEFNLLPLSLGINKIVSRLEDKQTFSRDLIYLQRNGISQAQLAILFNTCTRNIRYWKSGQFKPRKLSYMLMIREMAKWVREKEKAQREAGLRPQVVRC
ncbi:hypothetical protein ES703_118390 [subsurface metagenome]